MPQEKKIQVRDAVSWLLFAYSTGHTDACTCDKCPEARKIAFGVYKRSAAAVILSPLSAIASRYLSCCSFIRIVMPGQAGMNRRQALRPIVAVRPLNFCRVALRPEL